MRPTFIFLSALLVLVGCPPLPVSPIAVKDTDQCGAMCVHIGPTGLKCPEGEAVYDSDLPGPHGVPNKSCTQFCQGQQDNGIFVNPRCVAQAPTCSEIEVWRQKDCSKQ